MRHKTIFFYFLSGLLFLLLFVLRSYNLSEVGLHDYDAVMNFLAAKAISEGDFSLLFHHAAPLLHLLDALSYSIFKSHLAMNYAQIGLQLVAVCWFGNYLKQKHDLSFEQYSILTLFIGSFPLLVYTGRCLTIDNGSLLFVLLTVYFLMNKKIVQASLFFVLAFGFNYKSILILPFLLLFLCFPLLCRDKTIKTLLKELAIFSLLNLMMLVFWTLLAQLLIGKMNRYIANLYYLIFEAHHREATAEAWVEFDLLYYFKYIFYFENPLLWAGLIGAIIFCIWKLKKNHDSVAVLQSAFAYLIKQHSYLFLAFSIALPTLLLEKAPRIWLIVLLVGYAYLFLWSINFKKGLQWVFVCGIILNIWLCERFIYHYSTSNYKNVVSFLQKKQIQKVYVQGTLQPILFLEDSSIDYEILGDTLITNTFILTDDYCVLADACTANKKMRLVKQWTELTLSEPFLYVEHSQYLGLNFDKSYQLWKQQIKKPTTIRLYEFE